jgi:hypothetical protein
MAIFLRQSNNYWIARILETTVEDPAVARAK